MYNSDSFDLKNWDLTIPVDSTGGNTGLAVTIYDLTGYQSQYFYAAADGAMVFDAPVDGATTTSTHYARSELREMNGSHPAAWTLAVGGTMTATLKIDKAPTLFDGTPGKEVIGQIHGKSNELCRLYWDNGTVYFKNDLAGPNNTELKFTLADAHGAKPNISIGEEFSYMIDAHGKTLTVKVFADHDVYTSVTTINSIWTSDTLYFKAGVYLGVNETRGTGVGQDSFYGLDFGHSAGAGLGGLIVPPPSSPSTGKVVVGTSSNNVLNADPTKGTAVYGGGGDDVISGHNGNDRLYGQAGRDTLSGHGGNDLLNGGAGCDTLTGGAGRDNFLFNTRLSATANVDTIAGFSVADDTIRLDDAIFHGLTVGTLAASAFHTGKAAHDGNDHVIYDPANGSLIYDSNGSAAGGAVKFAQLSPHLALTNADFLVV